MIQPMTLVVGLVVGKIRGITPMDVTHITKNKPQKRKLCSNKSIPHGNIAQI